MKIVAMAYNYEGLDAPGGDAPFFFFKNPDSIIGPHEDIQIKKRSHVWPEVELALRINETGKAFDGIAVANDVTAAREGRDVHLAFSKGQDTFLPMSGWINDFDIAPLLEHGEMTTLVNGEIKQLGKIQFLRYDPFRALAAINAAGVTMKQGDILLSGTCYHEKFPLRDGDQVRCEISLSIRSHFEIIGTTSNKVKEI